MLNTQPTKISFPITSIDEEQTFSQSQSAIVVKDYVCAICYGELTIHYIPNYHRVVVACALHGNTCTVGRVARATASIAIENSFKNYYKAVSAFPDLWGGLWRHGIKRDHAEKIAYECVCALCSRPLSMYLIINQSTKKVNPEYVTLMCPTHGNVGENNWGFVKSKDYTYIPPVDIRKAERAAAQKLPIQITDAPANDHPHYSKLGSIGIGDRFGETSLNHFTVVFTGQNRHIEAEYRSHYKSNPDKLNIRLPGRTLNDIFYMGYHCYRQGGLIASAELSNGHLNWRYYRDPETYELEISNGIARTHYGQRLLDGGVTPDKPIYTTSAGEDKYIKPSSKVQVCISELTTIKDIPNVGFFELNMNSEEEILSLRGSLEDYEKNLLSQGATLSGTKFSLSRHPGDNKYTISLDGLVSR